MDGNDQLIAEWLLATVGAISETKACGNVTPSHAMLLEVKAELGKALKAAISALEDSGEIIVGRTISDTYFKIKEDEQEGTEDACIADS